SLADGATITLTTSTPGGGPGEFVNTLSPHILLLDQNGNVVAQGMKLPHGRNETLTYTVPSGAGGKYYVEGTSDNATSGECYLDDPVTLPGQQASTAAVRLQPSAAMADVRVSPVVEWPGMSPSAGQAGPGSPTSFDPAGDGLASVAGLLVRLGPLDGAA